MDIPITLLFAIETAFFSIIFGASTLAVIAYPICLSNGYPRTGTGKNLLQSIYKVLRFFHLLVSIVVLVVFVVIGIGDGNELVEFVYGIKGGFLLFNAVLSLCSYKKIIPIKFFAPTIAASWYFLSTYNIYTIIFNPDQSIYLPIIMFASYFIFMHILFTIFNNVFKKEEV